MQHYRGEALELHCRAPQGLVIDAQVGKELPYSDSEERGFRHYGRDPGHDEGCIT